MSQNRAAVQHDLQRRRVATILGDLGVAPHVVSVVLGHAHIAEGATAVYARSRYQTEHREALQVMAHEIERIVTGLPPEKWSSLMYGLWPDGGLKNGKEATHCGRDRHEAAAG